MRAFVTGGGGFVGRHLVARLQQGGAEVYEYSGRADSLCDPLRLYERLKAARPDVVYHLAAHANVRHSAGDAALVFESNVRGTFNVLEAMRMAECRRIVFASSCSVYGEPTTFPSGEYTAAMPVQTSLYGASKLAGEALCQAYDSTYGFQSTIMRLVSQLGPGQTRGHLPDLFFKLMADPTKLTVMGNGQQLRSYMHIADCVEALVHVGEVAELHWSDSKLAWIPRGSAYPGIYNVSNAKPWTVVQSIERLCAMLHIEPTITYGTEGRGWVGDSPHIEPDTTRLLATGWAPRYSTLDAVDQTIEDLQRRYAAGERR